MKTLKSCLFTWITFLAIGMLICSIVYYSGIELGAYYMQFFLFMIGLTIVFGFIIFAISVAIFGVKDFFESGDAKEWWDAAKEGKTVYEKRNERRRK